MIKKFLHIINNLIYSFKLIYGATKVLFFQKILINILLIIFPFLNLHLWRLIINNLTQNIDSLKIFNVDIVLYIVIAIFLKFIEHLEELTNNLYNDKVSYFVEKLLVEKLTNIDYKFFDSSKLYDNIEDSQSLVRSINNITWEMFDLIGAFIKLIISFLMLSNLDIYSSIFIIVSSLLAFVFIKKIDEFRWSVDRESVKLTRKMNNFKEILIGKGIIEIRVNNLSKFFYKKYLDIWSIWYKNRRRLEIKTNILSVFVLLSLSISEIAGILITLFKVSKKIIGIGDFTYYIELISNIKDYAERFVYSLTNFQMTSKELDSLKRILSIQSNIENTDGILINSIEKLEFRNVFFHYPENDFLILKNCSFKIYNKEKCALVGLNGAGKSTIVKLCLRLYDVTEGEILINNINIKLLNITNLRNLFGVLLQDYCRYSLSFRQVVAQSNLNNISNDNLIWNSCDKSGIKQLVMSWEYKIDSNLTCRFDKNGKELSGGQWQKVSLTRAFFDNKSFYILDEPSSSLDPLAENEIILSLKQISLNGCSLIIAHRLSSLSIVDKIFVLKDGVIVEQGSHNLLISINGEYAKLFKSQCSRYIVN